MADPDCRQQQQQQSQQQKHPHHYQQIKHSYFHENTNNSSNLPNETPSSPVVCTSTRHPIPLMNSSTSPWYPTSAGSADNDDSLFRDGSHVHEMIQQTSSLLLHTDFSDSNQQPYENYGHFFVKKTFHKPTYCHHCVEMLWGLIGQGYYCEGNEDGWNRPELYSFSSVQFYLSRSLSKACHLAMLQHSTYSDQSEFACRPSASPRKHRSSECQLSHAERRRCL